MVFAVVDHKVEDYAKWKPVFDKHGETRKKQALKAGNSSTFLVSQITSVSFLNLIQTKTLQSSMNLKT